MEPHRLSIVIPTYCREKILLETIDYLLAQARDTPGYVELILVDQTPGHDAGTVRRLAELRDRGQIKWLRLKEPHITRSMNIGVLEARGNIILFTDDDIIPQPGLLKNHLQVYADKPDVCAVVGQVLQPGERPEEIPYQPTGGRLFRFLDFPFRSAEGMFIENAMGGNLSVVREKFLAVGGFDENFIPPVASRFESEFAKRVAAQGGKIWFEPRAGILHLRAPSGGTRSRGGHLASISPRYGVGDYYYAMVRGKGWERLWYICRRPLREIRTRFHLKHPWWIPVKFIGELRAIAKAVTLYRNGPKLMHHSGSQGYLES